MDYDSLPKGVDLSHWNWPAANAEINFNQLQDDGVTFCYLKVSQGMGEDPTFEANRRAAIDHNMLWLPYAWMSPGDGDKQIEFFAKIVGEKNKPAILDWEQAGVSASVLDEWITVLRSELGHDPLVYRGLTPPGIPSPTILSCPWVLAEYRFAPRVPAWDGVTMPPDWAHTWVIWQRSGSARLQGIANPVDLDVLAVPLARFKAWCDTGSWAQPSPQSGRRK